MLTVPGILSTYFSSPFLMTPSAPMTTGIVSVPVFHILANLVSKSLYLESFSTTFTDVFLFDRPFAKLATLNYSFVHIQNSLTSLVHDNKFFRIVISKTRLVRLF